MPRAWPQARSSGLDIPPPLEGSQAVQQRQYPVGVLIYSAITSLDGYVADEHGNFDWAAPSEEAHTFVSDLLRSVGTYLYGRRMYDGLVGWESAGAAWRKHRMLPSVLPPSKALALSTG